jgi:hypothetical protein
MLESAVDHLINNVLHSAVDYLAAENALSRAFDLSSLPTAWEAEARLAKRRAAELAIAIDGLPDRCKRDIGLSLTRIRADVDALCVWPGTTSLRPDCIGRVRGVANAYKHENLSDPTLPITSEADILVIGLGYGLDGFGVGKQGGVEVLVRDKTATSWKFLGDAPVSIAAWFKYLTAQGASIPAGSYYFGGVLVHT